VWHFKLLICCSIPEPPATGTTPNPLIYGATILLTWVT
jgi:hypothetical protein